MNIFLVQLRLLMAFMIVLLTASCSEVKINNTDLLEFMIQVQDEMPLEISIEECEKLLKEKSAICEMNFEVHRAGSSIIFGPTSKIYCRWFMIFHFSDNKLNCIEITEVDPVKKPDWVPPPKSLGDCPEYSYLQ